MEEQYTGTAGVYQPLCRAVICKVSHLFGVGVTLGGVDDGKTRYLESREVGMSSRVLSRSGDSRVHKIPPVVPVQVSQNCRVQNIEDWEGWMTSMTACLMDPHARSGFVLEQCVLVSATYCLLITGSLLCIAFSIDQVRVSLQCEPHMGSFLWQLMHVCVSGISLSVSDIHPDEWFSICVWLIATAASGEGLCQATLPLILSVLGKADGYGNPREWSTNLLVTVDDKHHPKITLSAGLMVGWMST